MGKQQTESWIERQNRRELDAVAERKSELLAERRELSRGERRDYGQTHFLHEILETSHKTSTSASGAFADYMVQLHADMARAISATMGLSDDEFYGLLNGTHYVARKN